MLGGINSHFAALSCLLGEAVERSAVFEAAGFASGQSIRRIGDRGNGNTRAGCSAFWGGFGCCELPLDGLVLPSSLPPLACTSHTRIWAAAAVTVEVARTCDAAAATTCPASEPSEPDKEFAADCTASGDWPTTERR